MKRPHWLCILALLAGCTVTSLVPASDWDPPKPKEPTPAPQPEPEPWSPPEAVIIAPEQANVGDLVILDGRSSTGDNHLWVADPRVVGRFIEFEQQIVFAIGTPGAYTFQLIVADRKAAIHQVTHTVHIRPQDPPTPGPGPGPGPSPPPVSGAVKQATEAATRAVDDPATAGALLAAFLAISREGKTDEQLRSEVHEARERVMLERSPESQKKDWVSLWREPVNKAIEGAGITYGSALDQVIEGLRAVVGTTLTSSQEKPTARKELNVYVSDRCPPCDLWKQNEQPKILAAGVNIRYIKGGPHPTPTFEFTSKTGGTRVVTGYTSASSLMDQMQ